MSALAIPSSALSLDTIYSKILGNLDQVSFPKCTLSIFEFLQNVMQSVFVIADDIIMIVGPIYGS